MQLNWVEKKTQCMSEKFALKEAHVKCSTRNLSSIIKTDRLRNKTFQSTNQLLKFVTIRNFDIFYAGDKSARKGEVATILNKVRNFDIQSDHANSYSRVMMQFDDNRLNLEVMLWTEEVRKNDFVRSLVGVWVS